MLAFPNWEEKFAIEADASTMAVAAVITYPKGISAQYSLISSTSSRPHLIVPREITALDNWRLGP